MLVDISLKFYDVPSKPTWVTFKLRSWTEKFCVLKFLVRVFISLYLLYVLIGQVDTLHVGRYLSDVLCCTSPE